MKIIIVGAGISGLATYLYLRKNLPDPPSPEPPHSIHIYESHRPRASGAPVPSDTDAFEALSTSTAIVGGGLGVSPNGMRVLRDLDPEIHKAVTEQGFPCEHFIFMGQNGWTLGVQKTSDRGGYEGPQGQAEVCVSSTRHGLWACLMAAVPKGVVQYRKVSRVETKEGGVKVLVFEDGGEEECDLLIGADGVKSTVREALFGETAECRPVYTGTSGIGGIINSPLPARVADNNAMVFTFGRTGFFGYASGSPASANALMWWSTFETDSIPSRADLDVDEIKTKMKERHGNWADPVVRDIISKAEVNSIYPTWVLPDLPHWGENGIVLIGDAAHALSPTTGQGASQALEDSQTLSLLLAETVKKAYTVSPAESTVAPQGVSWVENERDAVAQTLKLFYDIRQPRVAAIAERGRKLDSGKRNISVVAEYAMYCFLWIVNHVPSLGLALLMALL
ncbi:Salicylate hydroxylase [Madurella mycetomatis]|uniref:Salicylate hydroxylase n=1 Tax=Madurella mycetomatis TaxID=100816 RepID=A0A175WCS0_9PEZI|nr:Salicylate hydroxylase [Madurella mycetomatis]